MIGYSGGAPATGFRVVSESTSLVLGDDFVVADAGGASIVITLPAASAAPGKAYGIKARTGIGTAVSVQSAGGAIDGAGELRLAVDGRVRELRSDGIEWHVTGGFG